MSRRPSRRTLVALAALPILGTAALAAPGNPDADLIRACDEAVRLTAALDAPGQSLPDDVVEARMQNIERLVEFAIATPATTLAGAVGKARVLRHEWPCSWSHEEDFDNGDLLIRSLVHDLTEGEA